MKTGVIKSNRNRIVIRMSCNYRAMGSCSDFQLKCKNQYSTSACSRQAKKFIEPAAFEAMKKSEHYIDLTISASPIDHTFEATSVSQNGISLSYGKAKVRWCLYNTSIQKWVLEHKHVGKKLYGLFELV